MKRHFIGLLACLVLSATFANSSDAGGHNRPLTTGPPGEEIRIGMTRAEVVKILGDPPEGFDYGDEMLWKSSVWRCFFRNDRVVAIQTTKLFRNGEMVLNTDSSKEEITAQLGLPRVAGNELTFPHGDERVVVALEPDFIGHTVTFIGVAEPDFDTNRFYGWVRPE